MRGELERGGVLLPLSTHTHTLGGTDGGRRRRLQTPLPDAWTRVCTRECVCGPLTAGPALFPDPAPAEAARGGGRRAGPAPSA